MVEADALNQSFEHIPMGEAFHGFFQSFAEKADRFAVLVIRIDDFARYQCPLGA